MFDTYTEPDPNQPRDENVDRSRFYPKNLIGHSLLVWVNAHIEEVPGAASADNPDGLDVTIVDLGPWGDAHTEWGYVGVNVIWQANSLIGKLKQRVGNPNAICVYLGKGQPAQKGWQAPFTLTDVSSDPLTRQKAEAWMAQNPGFVPNVRQQQPGSAPGRSAPAPTPAPPAGSSHPAPAAPAPAAPHPPVGPIRSTPPYPDSYPMPAPHGSTPAPLSAPPNGVHGPQHPYPAPGSGSGQQGWTGSPAPQSQQSPQPEFVYPEATPMGDGSIPDGVARLERAHEPGRNAILDSLRTKHGIHSPQDENPPF